MLFLSGSDHLCTLYLAFLIITKRFPKLLFTLKMVVLLCVLFKYKHFTQNYYFLGVWMSVSPGFGMFILSSADVKNIPENC